MLINIFVETYTFFYLINKKVQKNNHLFKMEIFFFLF